VAERTQGGLRTHLTNVPVGVLRDVVVPEEGLLKPTGLWYEVDGDWIRWMRDEGFWHRYNECFYRHEVDLGAAHVLALRTVGELDAFHERYWRAEPGFTAIGWIAWHEVAKEYDGVEIAPYQWGRRLDPRLTWYYAWDCSSGVVWNATKLVLGPAVKVDRSVA
jgi:hypothetical protein